MEATSTDTHVQAIDSFVEKLGDGESVMAFASQAQQFRFMAREMAVRLDALIAARARARAARKSCKHESPQPYHYRDPKWEPGRIATVVLWCPDCGAINFMARWELPQTVVG